MAIMYSNADYVN